MKRQRSEKARGMPNRGGRGGSTRVGEVSYERISREEKKREREWRLDERIGRE